VSFNLQWSWPVFREYLFDGTLLDGAKITLELTVVAQFLGIVLGILAALGKTSKVIPFRFVAELYIWLFRGTPVLVQILLWWQILPPSTPEFVTAFIALGLNEGAYMAEIVRAGLEAVDKGQTEAAHSLGMRYAQVMGRIVLPQAMRVIIPPTGNEFISMLKTTSLVSTISLAELLRSSQNIYECTGCDGALAITPLLVIAALYYLVLSTVFTFVQMYIESRLGDRRAQDPGWFRTLMGRGRLLFIS
jgi:polar amino acid transport system permease protein